MTFSGEVPQYVAINRVKAESAEAFESFIRDDVVPAVIKSRPELVKRFATLRSAGPNEDGSWSYAFAFYGDFTFAEWDLSSALTDALGQEAGGAAMAAFEDLLADQNVWSFAGTV